MRGWKATFRSITLAVLNDIGLVQPSLIQPQWTGKGIWHTCQLSAGITCALLVAVPAAAAPLDGLLSAIPERLAPSGYVEIGADRMSDGLDVFRIRESDPLTAGTTAGDYQGQHLSAAWHASEGLWLSGGLWERHVSDASDTYFYNSWQVAAQYRFVEAQGARPALALRLSSWGNRASATESSTPVNVPGAKLNTVKVTEPADQQLQADLIATWVLTPTLDVSGLLSGGSNRLSYGALSATTTRNGCNYQLSFTGNDIFGTLIPPCSAKGGIIEQFFDSSGDYGVDVAKEIAWRGTFMQLGINSAWRNGPWTLQGAYLFHAARREAVDSILASRGKSSYTQNHTIMLESDYRLLENVSVFTRAQFSSSLLMNDIPVTYNSSTAGRFGSKYSLFSVGLRALF